MSTSTWTSSAPGYEKMYVVRPQQFLTIISLLVQTGRNTVKVKKELADAKNREIDVTHFEERLENFKGVFGKHVKDAASRYNRQHNCLRRNRSSDGNQPKHPNDVHRNSY